MHVLYSWLYTFIFGIGQWTSSNGSRKLTLMRQLWLSCVRKYLRGINDFEVKDKTKNAGRYQRIDLMGDFYDIYKKKKRNQIHSSELTTCKWILSSNEILMTCSVNLRGLFNAKFILVKEVWLVWFCWGLWHINHCWLFNAKSCLWIYIKYELFVNTFLITSLNERELFFTLHTIK